MRVYELLGKLDDIEQTKARVNNKLPGKIDKNTEVTLNYFKDVLPLLVFADEFKCMLERLEVDYACRGINKEK